MPINDPSLIDLVKSAGYVALASIGGFLGYVLRTMEKAMGIQWGRALIETFASGFVGVMVLFMGQAVGLSGPWLGFIVGVFGWAGAPASMLVLEKVIFKKLGVEGEE